ncbi:MAG: SWIM zinc finger family protein [Planctomycetes bacterium]|nr:SWIM zinc finger family protein [Planctomycetota bacterium]
MSALALDYSYRYQYASEFIGSAGRSRLKLATFGGHVVNPYFFEGRLIRPRRTADLLRALMEIVHSRFHIPAAMLARIKALADPVVTSSENRLRFEGFSGCCSAYARVDLLPEAVDGEAFGRGTTNVDFNAPMLTALARIRDSDTVALSVGTGEVRLDHGDNAVIEKKVALPVRWLKGFVEVQAYQSRMQLVHDVGGVDALRFLRSIPRTASKHASWIVPSGRGLRLSQVASRDGVQVAGLERVRILENLAPLARQLRIFGDSSTGTAGFELVLDEARFHLVLSPDVWRGFSGEGQVLTSLAAGDWEQAIPIVRKTLKWDATIDAEAIVRKSGLTPEIVRGALSALGARGLVGYDLEAQSYFHRELPFDLSLLDEHQPRLKGARKLIAENKVRLGTLTDDQQELFVAGTDVEHRVRVSAAGSKCTCPWYSKHQGDRGPCKHVLAAQMFLDSASPQR